MNNVSRELLFRCVRDILGVIKTKKLFIVHLGELSCYVAKTINKFPKNTLKKQKCQNMGI